ncbi:MAG: dihydropteroate synthase-like protein [Desulfurococcales archaeon]|nr:dihydropteroate synthase-like protein [Desulfurococcales archaeon]
MRIAVLTSKAARKAVEEVVSPLKGEGVDIDVIDLPLPSISMHTTETLSLILRVSEEALSRAKKADVVLIPGVVRGDAKRISEVVGRPVYKAGRDLGTLPIVVSHLARGGTLDSVMPAEKVIGDLEPSISYEPAFAIGRIEVPRRGPPVILVSEIPPSTRREDVGRVVRRMIDDGAQIILVGVSQDMDPGEMERRLSIARSAGAEAVFSEAPTIAHIRKALDWGVDGLSVSPSILEVASGLIDSKTAIVVGDRDLGRLKASLSFAVSVGIRRLIVDPVVGIPIIDLADSVARYAEASRLGPPMLFSAANALEEIDADTHGMHAVMAILSVELRASMYLVVEESYKSYRSTAEAREALRLATMAYARKAPPRGLYSRLFVVKQPSKPPRPHETSRGEMVWYLPPRLDKRGYVEISVDHERGVITASYKLYRGRKEVVTVEGVHGPSIARALIRKAGLDPEHSAYLGYELCKAEIALRLGKSYVQDEPVIVPIWEAGEG